MQRNVLIGMGAAGSRIVSSAVHLTMAGAGPNNLSVGLVEQNPTCPDATNAQDILANILRLQNAIRGGPATPHRVGSACPFARTQVRPLGDIPSNIWRPAGPAGALAEDARKWSADGPDAGMVMRALFDVQTAESNLFSLTDFGARFDLAAFAIASGGMNTRQGFWNALKTLIYHANAEAPVRIILVGAAFEAIGAGSFQFARLVNSLVESARTQDFVDVGCVLLSPHQVAAAAGGAQATHPPGALDLSRSTLDYYARALEEEPVIQQLYVVGWSPGFQVNGGTGLIAKPSGSCPADLFAALAILAHYERPGTGILIDEPSVSVSDRAGETALQWDDLARAWANTDGQNEDPAEAIAKIVTFAYNWRTYFGHQIQIQAKKAILREQWFKDCCPNLRMVSDRETDDFTRPLDEYVSRVLSWSHEIGVARQDSDAYEFRLWRAEILAGALNGAAAQMAEADSDARQPENLIFSRSNGSGSARPARALGSAVGNASISADAHGLGRFVEALYGAGLLPAKAAVEADGGASNGETRA